MSEHPEVSEYPEVSEHPEASEYPEASEVLIELWGRLNARHWDRIAELLDPAAQIRYVHTGEVLDRDAYVLANQDFPGTWQIAVQDIVSDDPRVVTLARLDDGTKAMYVASFATVRQGLITDMVEVWTDTGLEPHSSRMGA